MRAESKKALESLSWTCHLSGVVLVFAGAVITFMNVLNGNFLIVQYGIYIFVTGYAQVKISSKLTKIIYNETAP